MTFSKPPISLLLVLMLAGFLLVTTGFATTAADEKEEPRKSAIIDQILDQRQNVDDLDAAVAQLRSQVREARMRSGNSESTQTQQLQQDLALTAATSALQGPAVVVRVADASTDDRKKTNSTVFGTDRVQDNDLQLMVNALFASGAEAIAINDHRLSVMSPIRAAGGTIVVNYRPVSSPYRIVAIGADKEAFEKSPIAVNFSQWKDKYQLGFSISTSKREEVPAYSGRVNIDEASPN